MSRKYLITGLIIALAIPVVAHAGPTYYDLQNNSVLRKHMKLDKDDADGGPRAKEPDPKNPKKEERPETSAGAAENASRPQGNDQPAASDEGGKKQP
jgi:hypothetical protein